MSDASADPMQALPPEQLVPGDPDGTDQLAQTMLRFSEVFADAAHALGLVDLVWVGDAAQAFQNEFDLQPAAYQVGGTGVSRNWKLQLADSTVRRLFAR